MATRGGGGSSLGVEAPARQRHGSGMAVAWQSREPTAKATSGMSENMFKHVSKRMSKRTSKRMSKRTCGEVDVDGAVDERLHESTDRMLACGAVRQYA